MRAFPYVVLLGCVLPLTSCATEHPTAIESLAVCPAPAMASGNSPVSASDTLFEILASPQLTAEQERLLSIIRSQRTTAEVYLARLSDAAEEALEEGNAVVLPVSPTRRFTTVGAWVERRTDSKSFAGPISGEHGWVNLVLTRSGLTGALQSLPRDGEPANYSFAPLGGGLHALVCIDQSKFPPDHPPGSREERSSGSIGNRPFPLPLLQQDRIRLLPLDHLRWWLGVRNLEAQPGSDLRYARSGASQATARINEMTRIPWSHFFST